MREEVIREVLLPASADEVWKALTEPGRLAEWLADDAEIELRRGGEVRFRLAGGDRRTGFVDCAERPWRLCFWWRPDEGGGDAQPMGELRRVEFSLVELPEGTRLRVVESRQPLELELRAGPPAPGRGAQGPPAPQAHATAAVIHA